MVVGVAGSNNLGATQCPGNKPGIAFKCAVQGDHDAQGKPYKYSYKYFIDANGKSAADNAVLDYLRQFGMNKRPKALAAAKNGDLIAYATVLRTKETTSPGAYYEDPLKVYIAGMTKGKGLDMQQAIAAALGQPIAVTNTKLIA